MTSKMRKVPKIVTLFILNSENKLLIVKRSKNKWILADKWGYPGGVMEKGETTETAVHREVVPKVGFDVTIANIGKKQRMILSNKEVDVIPVLCRSDTSEVKLNYKNSEYKWIDPKELLTYNLGVKKDFVIKMTKSVGLIIQ